MRCNRRPCQRERNGGHLLLLKKIVEAVKSFLKELFSLFRFDNIERQ